MKNLDFFKNGIFLQFAVDDDGRLLVKHIGTERADTAENKFFAVSEVFASGENPNDHHGAKHTGSNGLKYESHIEGEDELIFTMKSEKLRVTQHYEFFGGIKAVRAYATVESIGGDVGLEYVSSFCMYGFALEKLWLCHNSWCRELQWYAYSPEELGFNHINDFSTKRIAVSNTGTWSAKEYLPLGIIQNGNESIFWQIESNNSWNFEISDIQNVNYLKLSGPSEQENAWWRELKHGESFETVKTAVCFDKTADGVLGQMTEYRRKIAYRSTADAELPVIFNDYMGCLNADPTTEKELAVIDAAAAVGAEVFCMDAGWYADGTWWETVGEWKVCESRFAHGMGEVFGYIRKKGMKPGIWLEPEVMGINCPIADRFSDDCFFMRHGKRVIDHGRYHFDFRNKKVTDFLDGVVDGLIRDYGIEYFKFDYNIDGGLGTEVDSDSFGDGLARHGDAYLGWIDGLYARHPGLIIENCASGGMRMDYKSLAHTSVQSLSDASDFKPTAAISAMSATAVIPEQAQVWVLPMRDHTEYEISLNAANAMFARPVVSGETHLLPPERFAVLRDGIDFYKSIRREIAHLVPFYPCGAAHFGDEWMVNGFFGDGHDYLCVKRIGGAQGTASIDIPIRRDEYIGAQKVYPRFGGFSVGFEDNGRLRVSAPCNSAVIIKLTK